MSPASGVTGTSYVDKTAKLGVTYIYTVAAVGNGITSNFVATSALKFDPIPTVTIGTATNGIRVNWNAINGADSYIIYKKTYNAKTGKWGTWTTVAQNYKGTTVVDTSAAAVTQVWKYVGELIFNMLVLVGTIKMADRVVREMMGL